MSMDKETLNPFEYSPSSNVKVKRHILTYQTFFHNVGLNDIFFSLSGVLKPEFTREDVLDRKQRREKFIHTILKTTVHMRLL